MILILKTKNSLKIHHIKINLDYKIHSKIKKSIENLFKTRKNK